MTWLNNRDWNDPRYKEFRRIVRARDRNKCRWPGCKKYGKNVHHIKTWAAEPILRFNPLNGILLCAVHHKQVTGKEMIFAPLLLRILAGI